MHVGAHHAGEVAAVDKDGDLMVLCRCGGRAQSVVAIDLAVKGVLSLIEFKSECVEVHCKDGFSDHPVVCLHIEEYFCGALDLELGPLGLMDVSLLGWLENRLHNGPLR